MKRMRVSSSSTFESGLLDPRMRIEIEVTALRQ